MVSVANTCLRVNHWNYEREIQRRNFSIFQNGTERLCYGCWKNDYGLLWLKISGALLKSAVDTYVGYLYAREKTSRVYRHEDIDYFELLESDIAKFQNLGKVLVTRDFNGRTGTNSDFIIYDRYIDAGPDDSIQYNDIPVRFNRDRAVDAYGRCLLELCKTTSLLIANGRLGSDSETGEFTFYGEKGCSTVDYLLLPFIDFETVSYLKFVILQSSLIMSGCRLGCTINK